MEEKSTKNVREALKTIPGVTSSTDVRIKDGMIENISIAHNTTGSLTLQRLQVDDSEALFDFYFHGLSEKSRDYWPPYPLFSPPVESAEELAGRIKDWQKEDDWTVLKLLKGSQIIGIGLLKRYKTEQPTSGLAVREEYQGKGLGRIIQTLINEQARLLRLKELYITLAQDNTASFKLHKECGFTETGNLVPHYVYRNGAREIDRQDLEMIIKFG
ncbi:GNAT family N-acetyltransferase [Chloroflexota bacterium]